MQPMLSANKHDIITPPALEMARGIRPLMHREAASMATTELECFLALVGSLESDDWEKPTVCPLWNVRQILAHVTGATASFARWSEFKHQMRIGPKMRGFESSFLL